jgi:hypothetical protein
LNSVSTESSWQKIKLGGVNRLVNAPLPLRWQWAADPASKAVWLVSPRGVRWQFRLRHGAAVRRVPPDTGPAS